MSGPDSVLQRVKALRGEGTGAAGGAAFALVELVAVVVAAVAAPATKAGPPLEDLAVAEAAVPADGVM